MIGVIDVGGGMRAAYGAGVFDWCMDNHIHFDYCVGVSAGSANLVSYLAGLRGRNYVYYTDYNLRGESMKLKNFAKSRKIRSSNVFSSSAGFKSISKRYRAVSHFSIFEEAVRTSGPDTPK